MYIVNRKLKKKDQKEKIMREKLWNLSTIIEYVYVFKPNWQTGGQNVYRIDVHLSDDW